MTTGGETVMSVSLSVGIVVGCTVIPIGVHGAACLKTRVLTIMSVSLGVGIVVGRAVTPIGVRGAACFRTRVVMTVINVNVTLLLVQVMTHAIVHTMSHMPTVLGMTMIGTLNVVTVMPGVIIFLIVVQTPLAAI
jgi:hypothetical protein